LSDPRPASNPIILKAFSLPGEDELAASPGSSDWEDSDSGVDLPVLEVTLAKVICGSSQAKSVRNSSPVKSLIRRGFLGPRAAPTPTVLDDALPAPASALLRWGFLGPCPIPPTLPNDKASVLGRRLSQPVSSTSYVSKSQLGYSWRVKEKVAKQLNKNKELLAEAVVITPGEGVEGSSNKVLNVMNVATVVGMT
jgi:hypothetical protein